MEGAHTNTKDISEEKKRSRIAVKKKLKRLRKGIQEKQQSLEEAQNWQGTQHLADLLKAHFYMLQEGMSSITIPDWEKEGALVEIPLEPLVPLDTQLKALYTTAKKQKKAILPLQKIVQHLHDEEGKWEKVLTQIESTDTLEALESLQREHQLVQQKPNASKVSQKQPLAYHVFYSASHHTIYVGKSAEGNDFVTFKMGHGDDLWLHIHGTAGSHVLIKKQKNMQIDPETIADAAHLAIYFSKERSQLQKKHEVILCERREVSRMKKMPPGKVTVRTSKTLCIVLDPQRIEAIKDR